MRRASSLVLPSAILFLGTAFLPAQEKPLRAPDVPFDPSPMHVVDQMNWVSGDRQ